MNLMAIDPGKTTGIAAYVDGYFKSFEVEGGLISATDMLRGMLARVVYNVVIFEKFEIHASTTKTDLTDAYTALYINGNILTLGHKFGLAPVEQRPKDKLFANSNQWRTLKAVGWYETQGDGHCNDAAAHLLKYMVDKRILPDNLFSKIIDSELSL